MASIEQSCPWTGESYGGGTEQDEFRWAAANHPPLQSSSSLANVGSGERMVSLAAGSLLSLLGLERRGRFGWLVAGLGGAMLYRGLTGRCYLYQKLDISTLDEHPHRFAASSGKQAAPRIPAEDGIHIAQSLLINQSPETLYNYWRQLENLPHVFSHLKSVQVLDATQSRWIADAPGIAGGEVQWDAEITADQPHSRIAWSSLPGSTVQSHGSVSFSKAPGDRGTAVHVEMRYSPPGGQLGHWISKLFGEAPDQQIHEDLRNFKRLMEAGEVLTTAGQPHGQCK